MISDKASKTNSQRDLWIARALALVCTLVLVSLGAFNIATESVQVQTRYEHISIIGRPAIWMGGFVMAIGLVPMAFWFQKKHHAMVWTAGCLAVAALLFITLLSAH
jgi:cell division protein FtsW (lipid II flippase)